MGVAPCLVVTEARAEESLEGHRRSLGGSSLQGDGE